MQADRIHQELCEQVNPTLRQQACLAGLWNKCELRRRQLDNDMHAACAFLSSLPSHVPLPVDFLSHLDALASEALGSENSHCILQQMQRCSLRNASMELLQRPKNVYSYETNEPHTSHSRFMHRSDAAGEGDARLLGQDSVQFGRNAPVRFLGQSAGDQETAHIALQELKNVQHMELDLLATVKASQMPGVLLGTEQCMKFFAGRFMSHAPFVDFMQLCQIAATQQNRRNLFREPFPGAVAKGCFKHVLNHQHEVSSNVGDDSLAL
jgi:hypothetical protein